LNDSELVQGLRRREPAAMQWLCDCYLPSLWRFVYTRVHGDSHLAEDITNETILTMLSTIQSDNRGEGEISNPAGWLRTVAGRRISDHFRAASRVQHLMEEVANQGSDRGELDPAYQHALQETRSEVRQVMDELPEKFRLALEWKYLDKVSVREIAARWGMSEKAAESILFRARREFRERLANVGPKDPSRNGKPATRTQSTDDSASKVDASQKLM
jgi:RNA polymerase sigma factor (sigma-70 family)